MPEAQAHADIGIQPGPQPTAIVRRWSVHRDTDKFARLLLGVPDNGRVRNRDGSKKGAANFCNATFIVEE